MTYIFELDDCPDCSMRFDCPVDRHMLWVCQVNGDVINNQGAKCAEKIVNDVVAARQLRLCSYIRSPGIIFPGNANKILIDIELYDELPRIQEVDRSNHGGI